jgi:hypothetical protein
MNPESCQQMDHHDPAQPHEALFPAEDLHQQHGQQGQSDSQVKPGQPFEYRDAHIQVLRFLPGSGKIQIIFSESGKGNRGRKDQQNTSRKPEREKYVQE